MKMKVVSKRITAFVLCILMLVSCWVFTSPAAVADGNAPAQEYYVEIDVNILSCDNGYSSSRIFNGPDTRKGDGVDYYKDQGGLVIWYRDKNGRGDALNSQTIDFGPNGLNYVYDGGPASEHTIIGTLSGFPTAFAAYNNNDHNLSIFGSGDVEWEVTAVRVGSSEANTQTIWQGNLHVKNRDGEKPARYIVNFNGSVSVWSVSGISDSDMETNPYTYVMNSKGDYIINKLAADDNYNTNIEPWELPYADSIAYYGTDTNCWGESLNIIDNSTVFTPNEVAYCKDQYGVKIAEPTIAYGVSSYVYNDTDMISGSTVDEQFIQTVGDLSFDQKTGTISAGTEGYVADRVGTHTLSTITSFIFGKPEGVSYESTTVLNYPTRTVKWKYLDSTNELDSTQWLAETSTQYLGDTVTDADYPGSEATRSYYTKNHHYTGGGFEDAKVVENDMELRMTDYTEFDHHISVALPIEGDNVKHNFKCDGCDYTITELHSFDEGVTTQPTCTQLGTITKTCADCGYIYVSQFGQLANHTWDEGRVTKQATCFEGGTFTRTCTVCHATVEEPTGQLDHQIELHTTELSNATNGSAYYECILCHKLWAAYYDAEYEEYDFVNQKELFDTLEEVEAISGLNLPAPTFNSYTDSSISYNYATRGASLKTAFEEVPSEQPLRFTGSVKVPENVSIQMGSTQLNSVITDVGFVYTQKDYVGGDITQMQIHSPDAKIATLSILQRNEHNGVYQGNNWGGISLHELEDGTYLTFNISIHVSHRNWDKEYCVLPYITYKIAGVEFTVYDSELTSRSVQQVAEAAQSSATESDAVKAYCNELLDVIRALQLEA